VIPHPNERQTLPHPSSPPGAAGDYFNGLLGKSGNTRAREYKLNPIAEATQTFEAIGLEEDVVWSAFILPLIRTLPENVLGICSIAASEMIDNAIDHSESGKISVSVVYTPSLVNIVVRDFGVGIFRKVARALNLVDERQAIIELAKGKLTTAPKEHSGYGIFFTSRMVDLFKMASGNLIFTHTRHDGDWLVSMDDNEMQGTFVELTVATTSQLTAKEVYDRYCGSVESELGFASTHVPLRLAEFGPESLVSRSQAKRVMARVDRFNEVLLDFAGIEMVGQGFIDEIFRVYAAAHPQIAIRYANAAPHIVRLINLAGNPSSQ
jgi:anti-sigma regulatory factor (Ser/Thr protein kinase)